MEPKVIFNPPAFSFRYATPWDKTDLAGHGESLLLQTTSADFRFTSPPMTTATRKKSVAVKGLRARHGKPAVYTHGGHQGLRSDPTRTTSSSTLSSLLSHCSLRSEPSSPSTSNCAEECAPKNDPTQPNTLRKLPRELRQKIFGYAMGYNDDSKTVMKAFIRDPLLYEDVIFVMNKQWTFSCSYLCFQTSDPDSAWPYTGSYECLRIFKPRPAWNFIQRLSINCWRYAPKSTRSTPPNLNLLCQNILKIIPGLRSLHIDLIGSGRSLSSLFNHVPRLIDGIKALEQFSSTYQYCTSLKDLRDPLGMKLKTHEYPLLEVNAALGLEPEFSMPNDEKSKNLPTGGVDDSRRIYVRETRTWKAAKGHVMTWDWQAWEKKLEEMCQEKENEAEVPE